MNSKALALVVAICLFTCIAADVSHSQNNPPSHSSSDVQAKRPINRNPVALRHHPDDPRYRPHPSGGRPDDFDRKYADQAARGQKWAILRDCASACTMGFAHFPKNKICIGDRVRLGFHKGNNPRSTQMMWNSYPADVRSLVTRRGGMRPEWLWIPASEFHKLGYPRC